MKRILIAGIGNIFLGDDGFGCEVARELSSRTLPEGVIVRDFGIRSYDLAYALVENYDTIVLADATQRGDSPGTTYLIEIDLSALGELERATADPHLMNPVAVLQMAQTVGPVTAKIFLLGCEPSVLESADGEIQLSEPVQRAVPQAVDMIEKWLQEEFAAENKNKRIQVIA